MSVLADSVPLNAAWPGVSKTGSLTLAAALDRAAHSSDTALLLIHSLVIGSAWATIVALLNNGSVSILAIEHGPWLMILQQIATIIIGNLHFVN